MITQACNWPHPNSDHSTQCKELNSKDGSNSPTNSGKHYNCEHQTQNIGRSVRLLNAFPNQSTCQISPPPLPSRVTDEG